MAKGKQTVANEAPPELRQVSEPEIRRLAAEGLAMTYEALELEPRRIQLVVDTVAGRCVLDNPSWFETRRELDLVAAELGLAQNK